MRGFPAESALRHTQDEAAILKGPKRNHRRVFVDVRIPTMPPPYSELMPPGVPI
jgi:hypothetical protein